MKKLKKKLKARYLTKQIIEIAIENGKMAFLSGPRQVGKTIQAGLIQEYFDESLYKNWDQSEFKKVWTKGPDQIALEFDLNKENQSRLLVLDEIHKSKSWKQKLKGLYDTRGEDFDIIVTGSARLDVYKRGSDSLLGRYYHFRMHPFSLRELIKLIPNSPEETQHQLFEGKSIKTSKEIFEKLITLMEFSGFPEPYLRQSKSVAKLWRKGRNEKIIKEDLRDLSRVQEIGQVEALLTLMPDKIGSPLSVQSLREDLGVAHDTVSRWLNYLKALYFFFEIKPYSRSIPRSLKKEGKIYFYDWTENKERGPRFENLIASHILKACHYWEDTGQGDFQLTYLRNKEKQEVDFLIIKDKKPWFTVECKYKNSSLETAYKKFSKYIDCPHIQVVFEKGIYRKIDDNTWIMGADKFLMCLV